MHARGQGTLRLREIDPYAHIEELCRLAVVDCGPIGPIGTGNGTGNEMGPGNRAENRSGAASRVRLRAIHGSPATETSFKSILGLGLLLLARERGELAEGQPVVESTSGSLGLGLAVAGQILGHEIHLVTDHNIPAVTRLKIELAGAVLHIVEQPHPTLGFQQARDDLLASLLAERPEFYWTNQNDSPLNPQVYERWMVPHLLKTIDFGDLLAGIFAVGSGGHFSALSAMLATKGVPSYAADRAGSITFGGTPGPSMLRGIGNQNKVPRVIGQAMPRLSGVYYVTDSEARAAVRELAARGISVGGSSGACFAAARKLAVDLTADPDGEAGEAVGAAGAGRDSGAGADGAVLTFFADRGELYGTALLDRENDD